MGTNSKIEENELDVYKHQLDSFALTFHVSKHLEMKKALLSLIALQPSDQLISDTSHVNKLDWSKAKDFSRPWVQYFKPELDSLLTAAFEYCGYVYMTTYQLWFQQYQINDQHEWHTHGHNFTGVYYLDFPKGAPKTQLVNPYTLKKISNMPVKEGDILIFPSYVIHRAPKIKENINKTIISFNLNIGNFKLKEMIVYE